MKALDFKYKEVTSLFEHAKSIGLNPTLLIKSSTTSEFEFMWITLQIRDVRMSSRIYDAEWLSRRIKHYINKCSKNGEIRRMQIG